MTSLGPQRNESLVKQLAHRVAGDAFWSSVLAMEPNEISNWSLHVAVFHEPFLGWVLNGRKQVESRFSQNQVAPFGEVGVGDVIALKKVGGPIVGLCIATAVWSYKLDPKTWSFIRERFAPLICADGDEFWDARKDARFATLISLDRALEISAVPYPKSDRRGWVVENSRFNQKELDL